MVTPSKNRSYVDLWGLLMGGRPLQFKATESRRWPLQPLAAADGPGSTLGAIQLSAFSQGGPMMGVADGSMTMQVLDGR